MIESLYSYFRAKDKRIKNLKKMDQQINNDSKKQNQEKLKNQVSIMFFWFLSFFRAFRQIELENFFEAS